MSKDVLCYDNETRLLTARERSYEFGRVQKARRNPVMLDWNQKSHYRWTDRE